MRVVIAGAAGRDFHNFNTVYRGDPTSTVVAFTAAQIPGIAARRYPAALAGPRYPQGIPIVAEAELEALVARERVDAVVLSYSDLAHAEVMHLASRALAAGADFVLLGPARTMLAASRPVIAVAATRTGAGKSPIARWISALLAARGRRVAVVRHPMAYGDLERQAAQRFASRADLDRADCTIEEREEYEPHLACGHVVHSGVDTVRVLARAAEDGEILLWDGGNNDFPFVRPDLSIVVTDALRPGHETGYHPGETCLRMADVVVVAKADAAPAAAVAAVVAACRRANPRAPVVRGALALRVEDTVPLAGRRVLVVEDGPTLTHGGMASGAGYAAAQAAGALPVDPREGAPAEIAELFRLYPHLGPVLPAVGYSARQRRALREAIERAPADVVVAATPANLAELLEIDKPVVRVRYEYEDLDRPGLRGELERFLSRRGL